MKNTAQKKMDKLLKLRTMQILSKFGHIFCAIKEKIEEFDAIFNEYAYLDNATTQVRLL